MSTDDKLIYAGYHTRTPADFLKMVAELPFEGECVLHEHDTSTYCDIEGEHCEVQEYSEDEDEAAALFTLIDMARKLVEPCDPEEDQRYRDAARTTYEEEGSIEISVDAIVSGAHNHAPEEQCNIPNSDTDGSYVAAWVWVSAEDLA